MSGDNNNAIARFNMANAFQHTNDVSKAVQTYDEAIKNAEDNDLRSKAYYNKGLSQLQQKDLQAAMESFKQSLRLTPGDNDARDNLEKARQELKRQQEQSKQDDKKPPQPPPKKKQQQEAMSRQMMEQKFKELQEQEKQLQNQIQKEKNNQPDPEKDW